MAKAHLSYSFSCQKLIISFHVRPNSGMDNLPWSQCTNVCSSLVQNINFSVIFTNAQRSCPMLASKLTAELACSELDTIEISLIWWYDVYSECHETFFVNSWAKIISISSKDTVPCIKQLDLRFSVFFPLVFTHSFTNIDNFKRSSPPIETGGKWAKKLIWRWIFGSM